MIKTYVDYITAVSDIKKNYKIIENQNNKARIYK